MGEQIDSKHWEVTAEGEGVIANGSHEAVLYQAIPAAGAPQAELMKSVPNFKVGFSKAMSAGWVTMDKKAEGGPKLFRKVESIEDHVQKCLMRLQKMNMDG